MFPPRLLPLVLLAAVAVPHFPAPASGAPRRPNILVIVADDLGYADLGFQGGSDVPTPRLDAFAELTTPRAWYLCSWWPALVTASAGQRP